MPPTVSIRLALDLLRVTTAALFMAHAATRLVKGTIPQFAAFLDTRGLPFPAMLVWFVTVTELTAGLAMITRRGVRWAAAALFVIGATGIVLIHARLGWWVGEHGTGGSEYSVALLVMLLVVAADDADQSNYLLQHDDRSGS